MKFIVVLVLLTSLQLSASVTAQRVSIRMDNVTFREVVREIERQTDLTFLFNDLQISDLKRVNIDFDDTGIDEVIQKCLEGSNLSYKIVENTVVIIPAQKQEEKQIKEIKGVVTDSRGDALPGVTVIIKGSQVGVTTDANGQFKVALPELEGVSLVFSFVGMKPQEIKIKDEKPLKVVMQEMAAEMDEVVVTGIFTRKKESFTGSSQTYKAEDLKMVGNQNLIQSLKTLDPAFAIMENNQYGSDPNRLPDIEIRGKSSIVGFKEQYGEDPNQPLFILDGFESTLQTIMDLSMDRIASVTILKDAASTAIYGSKAANGVVVVETKSPEQGRIRVSYNGNFEVTFADLTDYNLMNAAEKLEFEKRSGRFESNLPSSQEHLSYRYDRLLQDVKRGVNTYWMSEPLRTGLTQRHNVYVEGGDNQIRYGLGVNYTNIEGVMKNSKRQILSGNLDLIYRVGKLNFMNKLTVDYNKTNNPVVAFSEYSRANPYYRKRNANGGVDKWLEDFPNYEEFRTANPLWDDALNSFKNGNSFGVRNNFSLEYRPWDFLYVRGRFGINKSTAEDISFYSPDASRFDGTDLLKKGSYSNQREDGFGYEGDFTVTYGQLIAEAHQINAVFGASVNESSSESKNFQAAGFPAGDFTTPAFSNQYQENGKPGYSDYKKRSANFYFNGGYSYKNRYLMDVNLRADGTSVFGSNKQFTTTWAVGLAWNLYNESFIKDNTNLFQMFKIRASIGNPGNQNFGSFNTFTTYKFNNWMQNNFGTGLLVAGFGDPNLEWQKTLDKNIGFDLSMFNNRFHIVFDYYHKMTDPLMASIGVPLSVGVSSRLANIGKQVDKGFNGTIKYAFIYKPEQRINWTTSLSFRHGKAKYDNIGNSLDQNNRENLTKNLTRYYDGGSPTALWAVRSNGIDPATGQEVFINKNGDYGFTYSYSEEVVVGDSRPTMEGIFGNTFYYKGFSLSLQFRYSFGADAFNTTLYNKVENISSSDLLNNQDRRALYDRWQKPGDKARFKSISLTDQTPISSRFVQKNNFISLESARISYELPYEWLQKVYFSGLTLSAYMNDIFRFSTIENERGIDYPFARSVSFSISVNF